MRNPFATKYEINYTDIIAMNFELVCSVSGIIVTKKPLTDIKAFMVENVDIGTFMRVWKMVEASDDPTDKKIESGKDTFVSLTEKEITEYLKMIILTDKIFNSRYYIYVKDFFNRADELAKRHPEYVPEGYDSSVHEETAELNGRFSRSVVRLAKIRWRNKQKFLDEIDKLEKLVV